MYAACSNCFQAKWKQCIFPTNPFVFFHVVFLEAFKLFPKFPFLPTVHIVLCIFLYQIVVYFFRPRVTFRRRNNEISCLSLDVRRYTNSVISAFSFSNPVDVSIPSIYLNSVYHRSLSNRLQTKLLSKEDHF